MRIWFGTLLMVLAAGSLIASPILTCNLNGGGTPLGGCYTVAMFLSNDNLDWGAPSAVSGQSGLGSAIESGSNPFNTLLGTWDARTVGGVPVHAMIGPGFSGGTPPQLAREDNTVLAWDGSGWTFPDAVVGGGDHVLTFGGHFGSLVANPTFPVYPDPNAFGDHLLSVYNGNGPLVLTFDQPLDGVGFLISTRVATDVAAEISAYNGSTLLATYSINATEVGAGCATLFAFPPVPCDDAPFIGIVNTPGITSVQITASDSSGFLIDTLLAQNPAIETETIPEPSVLTMVGGGLIGLLVSTIRRRKGTRAPS